MPKIFSTVGYVVTYPYQAVRMWATDSSGSLPQYLRDRSNLISQVKKLESELAGARGSSGSLERLLNENRALWAMLGATTSDRIAAQVVARPNTLPYDVIQIDRGARDGVVLDAPVYLGYDQVIGYVTHVTPTYSYVSLVTSPGFKATVYILGPDIFTNAEGLGGGVLRVSVPQGIPLRVGQLVLVPSISSGLYGEIVAIMSTPTQPQQYAFVTPPIPIQSLRYVSVGTESLHTATFAEISERVDSVKQNLFVADIPADWLTGESGTSTATTTEVAESES